MEKMDIDMYEDEYEVISDDEVEALLASMQPELLFEHIREQIKETFNSSPVNYLKSYNEQFKYLKDKFEDNTEILNDLKRTRRDSFEEVMAMIQKKFNFSIEEDTKIKTKYAARALYEFFVLDYAENIKKFIVKYIVKNKKALTQEIKANKSKTKDVTSICNKAYFGQNEALILTELNYIIFKILPSHGFEEEFLEYIVDEDSSLTLDTIKEMFIENDYIYYEDNLFDTFMAPLFEKKNGYSTIVSNVTVELYNIYNKKSTIKLLEDE